MCKKRVVSVLVTVMIVSNLFCIQSNADELNSEVVSESIICGEEASAAQEIIYTSGENGRGSLADKESQDVASLMLDGAESDEGKSDSIPRITYRAHVQNVGWQPVVNEGELAGTTGRNLQMEGLEISLENFNGIQGNVEYQAHVQDIGWQSKVFGGELAGTVGKNKAIEAIRINLSGELAEYYDIFYRVHSADYGWFAWTKNGTPAGTKGYACAVQAIEIEIMQKDDINAPITEGNAYIERETADGIIYQMHVQDIGWTKAVNDGETAGVIGKNLESIKINTSDKVNGYGDVTGTVIYQTYVNNGWQVECSSGGVSGTVGINTAVQAIKVNLTEQIAELYDVYYRVYSVGYGWLDWAKNGEPAGTMGFSCPAQGVEIKLFDKNSTDKPEQTGKSYISENNLGMIVYKTHLSDIGWQNPVSDGETAGMVDGNKNIEALHIGVSDDLKENGVSGSVVYQAHVQDYGWMEEVSDGVDAGTIGLNKQMEAIRIYLTEEIADAYDVYYRVYSSKYGWLGWAKNGETAGTSGIGLAMKGIEIRLLEKGSEDIPKQDTRSFLSRELIGKVTCQAYVEDAGWQQIVSEGEIAGTVGQNKSIQDVKINIEAGQCGLSDLYSGGIEYALHVSDIGWLDWVAGGETLQMASMNKQAEAIKIRLTGELAQYADIYYRTHVSEHGWLGWACNGEEAGTTKCAYKLQAIEIKIVPKYAAAPGSLNNHYTEKKKRIYQNPAQYYQISTDISLNGGDYILSYGYEGVKVMQVIRRLGLGTGIGMGGAFYSTSVQDAVANFQRSAGLSPTGNVDLLTWIHMGFNQFQWEQWGAYISPLRVKEESNRAEHIEAMISTAYSYLGTAYVIGASGPPGTGIDCSGLVMQALYSAGLDISPINPVRHAMPGYEYESRNMWASSRFMHVPYESRERGDLIFYQNSSGVVIHVAIYLGNDMVIESWPNEVIVWPIRNGSRSNIKGVVRPFV